MPPHCDEKPRWQESQRQHGVIAFTATRSPISNPCTFEPSAHTVPTDSCPSVRPRGISSVPRTVWTSDVQTRACVVLTIASLGPGSGIGLSTTATLPTDSMTNAFIELMPTSVVRASIGACAR